MVNERLAFWVTLLGTIVGLVIMLSGVVQNAGQALNTPMLVGGAIALAAIGVLTYWLLALPSHHGESAH